MDREFCPDDRPGRVVALMPSPSSVIVRALHLFGAVQLKMGHLALDAGICMLTFLITFRIVHLKKKKT
jgi:hypothetical protein